MLVHVYNVPHINCNTILLFLADDGGISDTQADSKRIGRVSFSMKYLYFAQLKFKFKMLYLFIIPPPPI
jgi:hypothetical protein